MEVQELHEAQIYWRSGSLLGQVLLGERVGKAVLLDRKEITYSDQEQELECFPHCPMIAVASSLDYPGHPNAEHIEVGLAGLGRVHAAYSCRSGKPAPLVFYHLLGRMT